MGMDPINQLEVHEVTIQLSGKVTVQAFNEFQDKLRSFITTASGIFADKPANALRLQVRVVRQGVRSIAQ